MKFYGIYKITNLLNGKMYIGQHITSDIDDDYMGSGIIISAAIKKYGKQNFKREWLMFCEDKEELDYMERVFVDQTWLDRSDTYNLALGGISHRDFKKSTKQMISEKTKEALKSPEVRQRMGSASKGRTPWNKGTKGLTSWSVEQREHMSIMLSRPRPYRRGIPTWNKGLSMTDSQKVKISAATKNAMTDEVRHKISEANRNRKGKVYWNNGKARKLAAECPGKDWVRGRTLKMEIS